VLAQRHQANLVPRVPMIDASDEDVGTGRFEFAGDRLDVVGENKERGLRAALAEKADGTLVIVEIQHPNLAGEVGIAHIISAAEMDRSGWSAANALGQGGHFGWRWVAKAEMQPEQVGNRVKELRRLEHSAQVGVVRLLEELRVESERRRLVPVAGRGVTPGILVQPKSAGEGDGPSFNARERYAPHP